MYIKNRIPALIFRLLALAGCAYGIAAMGGLFGGGFSGTMLVYYTNLSNFLILVYLFASVLHTAAGIARHGARGSSALFPGVKRAFLMMITVTFLVYHFMLYPVLFTMNVNFDIYGLPNLMLHYITPILFILDWLLFDEKQRIRWFDPLLWLFLPFAYLVFIMVRAEVGGPLNAAGGRFPYYFLDIDYLGIAQVAGYVGLLLVGFTLLGYVIFLIDKIPVVYRKLTDSLLRSE